MQKRNEKQDIHIVSFTRRGYFLSLRMREALTELEGKADRSYIHLHIKKQAKGEEFPEAESVAGSLKEWCARVFSQSAALIFIGAAGIAVRTIAPFLISKATDPAVLVADEKGRHVISLLSGHLGGGNELAIRLAARLGADPVITTASDVNGRLAVDVWAKKNHCVIASLSAAKCVAANLVEGKRIPICVNVPMEGTLPEAFVWQESAAAGEARVIVSVHRQEITDPVCLHLIPRTVTLGIGCKKGKTFEEIYEVLTHVFEEQNLCSACIGTVASIDLKRDEPGILALAQKLNAPFVTFSAQELNKVSGEFTPSAFVSGITGVDNVCERSAVATLTPEEFSKAQFLCRKRAEHGVTVALLMKTWEVKA